MNESTSGVHVMTTAELVKVIAKLDVAQPLTDAYEQGTRDGRDGDRTTWYDSQKQHLLGWLGDYGGAGAYGRTKPGQDARFFYNHFRCPEGLMWLAEALGEDSTTVTAAIDAVRSASPNQSSRCGAFRRVIGWDRIAELVETRPRRRRPVILRRF